MMKVNNKKFLLASFMILAITLLGLLNNPVKAALSENIQWTDTMVVNLDNSKGMLNIYDTDQKLQAVFQNNKTIIKQYDLKGNLRKTYRQKENPTYSISNASLTVYVKQNNPMVQDMKIATWHETSSIDRAVTFSGVKVEKGLWKVVIKFSELSPGTGDYHAMIQVDGMKVNQIQFKIDDTVSIDYESKVSLIDEYITIRVSGVSPTVRDVRFPTWTIANGQDDLKNPWIVGRKIDIDTYEMQIPFRDHHYEVGKYSTHVYSFDKDGNSRILAGIVYVVEGGIRAPQQANISDVSYDIIAYGIDEKVKQVYFPTWTVNKDQDDIEWIKGVNEALGVWRATVLYNKHNDEQGDYITHVYADDEMIFSTNVNVIDKVNVVAPKKVELKDGSYQIKVTGLSEQVKYVYFPTWTEKDNQDDLINPWVNGINNDSGDWVYTLDFRQHKNESGIYITHIYAEDKYGNKRMIRGLSISVEASIKYPTTVKLNELWYDIYVYGLPFESKKVQFPTWTIANGQDELEWIRGEQVSDGVWRGRVQFDGHNKEVGDYNTDIYVDDKFYKRISVSVVAN